jgi:tetratricopeptide (TPR) repeat protein
MARLGADWGVIEKIFYLLPFAILSWVSPFLLAREVIGRTPATYLAPLIFAANPYMVLIGTGHLTIAMAEVVAPLVFVAYIRAIRGPSVAAAIGTALLLALESAYEIRITYLTVLMLGLYLLYWLISQPRSHVLKRIALTASIAVCYGVTQLYWILPLTTYPANPGLPIAASPWLAFMRLPHAIAAVPPDWTGAAPVIFKTIPVAPLFLLPPIAGFLALLLLPATVEMLWLASCALLAAFLIKQTNSPVGEIYNWMFYHVPGWSLFREASKLFWIVALAYAILIPAGFQFAVRRLRNFGDRRKRSVLWPVTMIVATIGSIALSLLSLAPLGGGGLGGTSASYRIPEVFNQIRSEISSLPAGRPILWFGGAVVTGTTWTDRNFAPSTPSHPVAQLYGDRSTDNLLTQFCPSRQIAFCYLDPSLFPFVIQRTGTVGVVAPAGSQMGRLPDGVDRNWLLGRLTAILGRPQITGSGDAQLAFWSVSNRAAFAESSANIFLVHGNPSSSGLFLPLLKAVPNVPIVYEWGNQTINGPTRGATNPEGIGSGPFSVAAMDLFPAVGNVCTVPQGRYSVMLPSSRSSETFSVNGESARVPLISTIEGGYSIYGPIDAPQSRGNTARSERDGLTACLGWSPNQGEVLAPASGSTLVRKTLSVNPERLSISLDAKSATWILVRHAYDPGWSLEGATLHAIGDGLFDLYYVPAPKGQMVLSFVSRPWEVTGALLAISAVLLCLLGLLALRVTRRGSAGTIHAHEVWRFPHWASLLGWYGISLLLLSGVVYAAAWLGIPSSGYPIFNGPWLLNDPYLAPDLLIALSIGLLVSATWLALFHGNGESQGRKHSLRILGLIGVVAPTMVLASCTSMGATDVLAAAQKAQIDGDANRCIQLYTQEIARNPESVAAYSGRAHCYVWLTSFGPVQDFSRAIALSPQDPALYVGRAYARDDAGDVAGARSDFERVGSLHYSAELLAAGQGLAQIGFPADALVVVNKGLEQAPDSWPLQRYRAHLEAQLGNWAGALSDWEVISRHVVGSELAIVLADRAEGELGRLDYRSAAADYRRAMEILPSNYQLCERLALAELGLGDFGAAESHLSKAIALLEESGDADWQPRARLLELRGSVLLAENKPVQAVSDYRHAAGYAPTHGEDRGRLEAEIAAAQT